MSDARIIKIDPSLPCNAIMEEGTCGRPAQAAWVEPILTGEHAGQWIVTPICADCAETGPSLYANERIAEFYADQASHAETLS